MDSLEQLTTRNIAVHLWNINSLPDTQDENNWVQSEVDIKNRIKNAVERGELNQIVADVLNIVVRIVGNEILKFMFYLQFSIRIEETKTKLIVSRSCWKNKAMLDAKKTISKAIQNEDLSRITKFKLASCLYIECCIEKTWNILSHREKIFYLYPADNNLTIENVWAITLENQEHNFLQMHRIANINEYIICKLVEGYNIDAIKFFFKRLSVERRESVAKHILRYIDQWFPNLNHWYRVSSFYFGKQANFNSLIVFLFSHISEGYDVVLKPPLQVYRILGCYLDWPYQENFLEKAKIIKYYIPILDYGVLTELIKRKIGFGFKDYDYRSLLDQENKFSPSKLIDSKIYVS